MYFARATPFLPIYPVIKITSSVVKLWKKNMERKKETNQIGNAINSTTTDDTSKIIAC